MNEFAILRGHVPLVKPGEVYDDIGWLRIGNVRLPGEMPSRISDHDFEFTTYGLTVAESAVDYTQRERRLFSQRTGESPIWFTGKLHMGEVSVPVEGSHFRSGNYLGQVAILEHLDSVIARLR